MEQFFKDIYMAIFWEWVNAQEVKSFHHYIKNEAICYDGDEITAAIHFWPNYIIEEEIFDKQTQQRIYYLHFQMNNIHRVHLLLKEFFDFMSQYKKQKILLCCSSAITTTYFAHEMNEVATKLNMPYIIEAIAYTKLDDIIDNYELILLAPQVAYLDAKLKKQFKHKKIVSIVPKIFATNQYFEALKLIEEEIKK